MGNNGNSMPAETGCVPCRRHGLRRGACAAMAFPCSWEVGASLWFVARGNTKTRANTHTSARVKLTSWIVRPARNARQFFAQRFVCADTRRARRGGRGSSLERLRAPHSSCVCIDPSLPVCARRASWAGTATHTGGAASLSHRCAHAAAQLAGQRLRPLAAPRLSHTCRFQIAERGGHL